MLSGNLYANTKDAFFPNVFETKQCQKDTLYLYEGHHVFLIVRYKSTLKMSIFVSGKVVSVCTEQFKLNRKVKAFIAGLHCEKKNTSLTLDPPPNRFLTLANNSCRSTGQSLVGAASTTQCDTLAG